MRIRNSAKAYGSVAIGLHWIVAVLVPAAWISGHLGDILPRGSHDTGLFMHVSLGLAMLGFALARLAWRLADPPPAPEAAKFGAWTVHVGEITHLLIYGIMFAIPVLGIVTQFARGYGLPVFGLFEIASPWVGDRGFAHDMKEMHEALANGLMILIGLHAGAALLHHYWLHDRTLRRMVPGLR
ncbi:MULTISPECIES: cytochrome b [unclassified Bradyrhizobium]|uniref:cytochrome b n=1 Tax=unclassified Bradyrhizobium TaxID=2631580 RepID=UPI0028E5177B|nr:MULTISPECIES: cytochrome b [unclassified Bradyrhizobium]